MKENHLEIIYIKPERRNLHEMLDRACDECKGREFVATRFTQLCMENLENFAKAAQDALEKALCSNEAKV